MAQGTKVGGSAGASLVAGAHELFRSKKIDARKLMADAAKRRIKSAVPLRRQKSSVTAKSRLVDFAIRYAHYLLLQSRGDFPAIVDKCSGQQDMSSVSRTSINSAVLRCVAGYKKGDAISRAKQRQFISEDGRAMAQLIRKGIGPDAVAKMKPGRGNSRSAWAKGAGSTTASTKPPLVDLAGLEIVVSPPGGLVVLLARHRRGEKFTILEGAGIRMPRQSQIAAWRSIKKLAKGKLSLAEAPQ